MYYSSIIFTDEEAAQNAISSIQSVLKEFSEAHDFAEENATYENPARLDDEEFWTTFEKQYPSVVTYLRESNDTWREDRWELGNKIPWMYEPHIYITSYGKRVHIECVLDDVGYWDEILKQIINTTKGAISGGYVDHQDVYVDYYQFIDEWQFHRRN